MDASPGTYVLLLRSRHPTVAQIGRRGPLDVRPGWYLYVGSAFGPGGLRARVLRHCRTAKARHWHVDHLREVTDLRDVWYSHAPQRLEHAWAAALAGLRGAAPVAGFGCSDCHCGAHLFHFARRPQRDEFACATGQAILTRPCPPAA